MLSKTGFGLVLSLLLVLGFKEVRASDLGGEFMLNDFDVRWGASQRSAAEAIAFVRIGSDQHSIDQCWSALRLGEPQSGEVPFQILFSISGRMWTPVNNWEGQYSLNSHYPLEDEESVFYSLLSTGSYYDPELNQQILYNKTIQNVTLLGSPVIYFGEVSLYWDVFSGPGSHYQWLASF